MTGVKISALPVASSANANDQLEVNQGGTSRRVTLDQVSAAIAIQGPPGEPGLPGPPSSVIIASSENIVHVSSYGAGSTGNATAAIVAAAAAAAAASLPLHFAPITYTISRITFPTGLVIKFNGAILRADGTVTGNNSIAWLTGGSFDDLNVSTPAVTAKVPVIIHGGCTGRSIRLKADAQSDNAQGESNTGAVRLAGNDIFVDDIFVENFDFGGLVGSTTTTPYHNIHIKRWQNKSQISAVLIRSLIGFSALELWGDVLSPNVTAGDGGFGSMFGCGGVQDVNIGTVWIRGAREHGWRCGGQAGTAVANKNITIGRITAINCCRTGVKINNDEVVGDVRYSGIDIGPILVENSSFASTPDANENGLLVEDCDGCTFGPVTVVNTDGYSHSSYYGISIRNSTNVSIRPGNLLKRCFGPAVHMQPPSQAATGMLSNIHIGKTKVIDCLSDACFIDAPANTLEDIIVDVDSENTTGFAWKVNALAATAPVILRGNVHNATAGIYSGSTDTDIVHAYTLSGGKVVAGTTYTVATLPTAASVRAGARAVVSDANATTFNTVVAAGGANTVPVFSDGTAWRIG